MVELAILDHCLLQSWLGGLNKGSTTIDNQSSQVTFDLLFGTTGNSNAKLKMMAVQFVHEIIHHCPENRLRYALGSSSINSSNKGR